MKDIITVLVLICLAAAIVWDTGKLPPEPQPVSVLRRVAALKPADPLVSVNAFAYLFPDYDLRTAKSLPFRAGRK